MTPDQTVDRGDRARRMLESDLVTDAFAALEAEYTRAWAQSDPGKPEVREEAYRLLTSLRKFRGHLECVMANGDLARRQRDDIQNGKRRWL